MMSTLGDLSPERQKELLNKAQELGATHILPVEIGESKCGEFADLFYKLVDGNWHVTADTLDYKYRVSRRSDNIPYCIALVNSPYGNNIDEWV